MLKCGLQCWSWRGMYMNSRQEFQKAHLVTMTKGRLGESAWDWESDTTERLRKHKSTYLIKRARKKKKNPQCRWFKKSDFLNSYFWYVTKLLALMHIQNLPAVWETQLPFLGQEDPLEKGMATHSSMLTWKIPWTEESGGLQSMGS